MVDNVSDVRNLTMAVYTLLIANIETHAPPRFTIEWGTGLSLFGQGKQISPLCVMESMNEEFTLFAPTGEPLRAKLTVTIRMAATIELQFQQNPRNSPDRTKVGVISARLRKDNSKLGRDGSQSVPGSPDSSTASIPRGRRPVPGGGAATRPGSRRSWLRTTGRCGSGS